MTYQTALTLGVMLVGVTIGALMIRRLVWSLILLFYASIVFGLLLISYDATFAGLFHVITFAGAVSVLFMVILMIVGGRALASTTKLAKENAVGIILTILAAVPVILLMSTFEPFSGRLIEQTQLSALPSPPEGALGFLWGLRAWDVLLIVLLVAAAMLGLIHLFSREGGLEK